jgi:hypothetical protein
MVLSGHGRMLAPPGPEGAAELALAEDGFSLDVAGVSRHAAYRDLTTVVVQDRSALLVLGTGPGAERVLLDRFGSAQPQLVRELRDRRLRQQAADALISLAADEPIGLVEYEADSKHGVAQLAYDRWGAILAPVDDRLPVTRMLRSEIASVRTTEMDGTVEVELTGRFGPARGIIRLVGLGSRARIHGDRFEALRTTAADDAARLIGSLIPDAPYEVRREAAATLIDGTPARSADLPTAWSTIEAGVLGDPTFARSYRTLRERAGHEADRRAIAIAPSEPGGDEPRTWFFVPLPGDLVAMELVSGGAHATYCFRARAASAATTAGAADEDGLVRVVSRALVESRFLREPMALSEAALGQPRYRRYRLAIAAIPSLAEARARFVGRVIHRDDESWSATLESLITWAVATTDRDAVWPGRETDDDLPETLATDLSDPAVGAT